MNAPLTNYWTWVAIVATTVAISVILTLPAAAGTLENMERERAILVETMLDADLKTAERQAKIDASRLRLIDLERMTLRDEALIGRTTPTVKRAFENYDLTFLAHAATEKDVSVVDNWLAQVGLTTETLMSTKRGRR